jgi:hypothetical protein
MIAPPALSQWEAFLGVKKVAEEGRVLIVLSGKKKGG